MRDDTLQLLPCAKSSATCKLACGIQTGIRSPVHDVKLCGDMNFAMSQHASPKKIKWHYVQPTCRELLLLDPANSDCT
jgi:hypothetical protein